MSMIDQTEKVTPVAPATPAVPADMPRDKAGNIAYECGNFFQSKAHSDGLPRPPHAHKCTKEHAFRDVTRREVRDYKALRKAAKEAPAVSLPKKEKGIVGRLLGMFSSR